LNLATDEAKLKKARGGVLNSKLYWLLFYYFFLFRLGCFWSRIK
jgi:hypothetical protein